jgi:hypothetical protein
MQALCEWDSGDFVDLSTPSCESAMHFQTVRSRLLTKLTNNNFRDTKACWALQQFVIQGMSQV